MFKSILDKASLGSIRIAISGGGPLSPDVFRSFNEFGIDFVQGYGLTETSPIIALNPKEHFKVESVGKYFYPYMDMKIVNPDENGIGEIYVRGPMVMKGYYLMPEATAEIITEDGYLKTGDLGYLDNEKYLYLCGRAKNMIVTSGGKNVFPEEIENMFQMYYNQIDQITAQGYHANKNDLDESVEVLVYPSEELYKSLSLTRGRKEDDEKVQKEIEAENIVSAFVTERNGCVEAISKMCFGNMLGANSSADEDTLFAPEFGSRCLCSVRQY